MDLHPHTKIGAMEIELTQYQNPDHPLVKSLDVNRPGLHHICYAAQGFDEVLEKLRADGFSALEGFPRKRILGKIAFLTPPHSSQERIDIIERDAK